MRRIVVKKTSNPDYGYTSKEELYRETQQHREDVHQVMDEIAYCIHERGRNHDWSKIEYFNQFAQDTLERQDTPDFKRRSWYNIHTTKERHHINANVPEDVNLFDCLEMIVDCVVAGKTRTGNVNNNFLVLPQTVMNNAYWNTVKLIKELVDVE